MVHSADRNGNLVLMARAEMGYLGHYNKNKVSPFERFEVGGDGMTAIICTVSTLSPCAVTTTERSIP